MNKQNTSLLPTVIYAAIFFVFYILTYTDILRLSIGNAAPQLLVSAVVAVAFFYGEWTGFIVGMVAGIFADAVAASTVCFNMITLMLIGLTVGLLINRYLNQNIFSAIILCAAANLIYFFAYWLIFFVFKSYQGSWQYFLYYSLPSAVYSTVFIFLTYLPGRYLK